MDAERDIEKSRASDTGTELDGSTSDAALMRRYEWDMVEDEAREEEPLDGGLGRVRRRAGHSYRGTLWVVMATASTLLGRRMLTRGYPYPLFFLAMLQMVAYLGAAITLLGTILWRKLRGIKQEKGPGREYTWYERAGFLVRLGATVLVSSASIMLAAQALHLYRTLPVLAMLPMFTYVFDSLLSRLGHYTGLVKMNQPPTRKGLVKPAFALICVGILVYEDYRLDLKALLLALAAFSFHSLAKLISRLDHVIDDEYMHGWDGTLYMHLCIGLLSLGITLWESFLFEDLRSAFWDAWAWDGRSLLFTLTPGAFILVAFNSPLISSYNSSPLKGAPAILEDSSLEARTEISSTLKFGFWVSCIGMFLGERQLVDWIQVLTCTILYVSCVGPKNIALYPPRLWNLLKSLIRKSSRKQIIAKQPWQTPILQVITNLIFIVVMSIGIFHWTVNVAYKRDLETWVAPAAYIDLEYEAPQSSLLDIVIAHSAGDPMSSIEDLIVILNSTNFGEHTAPKVKIFSKDLSLPPSSFDALSKKFAGGVSGSVLINSGGVSATFLHYIIHNWASLPEQTIFLSTESPLNQAQLKDRLDKYFVLARPTPFTSPKTESKYPPTSFLPLGNTFSCPCDSCLDPFGWTDTFHLLPSMSGAVSKGPLRSTASPQAACNSVLLTYGNAFIASGPRIRGTSLDTWQTLYDALVSLDLKHGWGHERTKIPNDLWSEEVRVWRDIIEETRRKTKVVKQWLKFGSLTVRDISMSNESTEEVDDEVNESSEKTEVSQFLREKRAEKPEVLKPFVKSRNFGGAIWDVDSVASPYLGYTMERLWAVLLQCSTPSIAWNCPSLERGWRRGGGVGDCRCG